MKNKIKDNRQGTRQFKLFKNIKHQTRNKKMSSKRLFIKETNSTNSLLKQLLNEGAYEDKFLLYTDFQTNGVGQVGNSWESERGKNLLFSILLYPQQITINNQFIISQIISLAIVKTLERYDAGFSIKWPNDIYWNDKKMGGTLIENSIQGKKIKTSIIGIGLNINQKVFLSKVPNTISLVHILGKSMNRKNILNEIFSNFEILYNKFDEKSIRKSYFEFLYRNVGFHSYKENGVVFKARIANVFGDGKLELETNTGEKKAYYFKEVEFVV